MKSKPLLMVLAGAAGGAVATALMLLLADHAHVPLVIIPFATSIVLIMGAPESEPAQPRAFVGGHLIATLLGLMVVKAVGPHAWAAAVSVGLAMVAMHFTRTFHPPAGINPLLVIMNDLPWDFLLSPVAAGAVLLTTFAFLWHNVMRRGSWPMRWW